MDNTIRDIYKQKSLIATVQVLYEEREVLVKLSNGIVLTDSEDDYNLSLLDVYSAVKEIYLKKNKWLFFPFRMITEHRMEIKDGFHLKIQSMPTTLVQIEFFAGSKSLGKFPLKAHSNHEDRVEVAKVNGIDFFDEYILDNGRVVARVEKNYYVDSEGRLWAVNSQ